MVAEAERLVVAVDLRMQHFRPLAKTTTLAVRWLCVRHVSPDSPGEEVSSGVEVFEYGTALPCCLCCRHGLVW